MAATTATLIVGAVIAAAGAGVSAYGQYQSGKTQNAIAQYNASQAEKQASAQLQAQQVANALQQRQTQANFLMRSAEAQARMKNAKSIEATALNQDAVARENLRKRREEQAELQATQRASIANSGVVESSGTPLDVVAKTAALIQQDREEQHYINETQRRTLFAEAAKERLGGKLALIGATMDRDSGIAEAGLRDAAARGEYLAGLRGAELTRLTGKAAAKAGMYQAGGTLLSGLGSAVSSYGTYKTS